MANQPLCPGVSDMVTEYLLVLNGHGDIIDDNHSVLSVQFVLDPGVLEGALPHVGSLLSELLHGFLVSPTRSVDQVASSGRLLRISMSGDSSVDLGRLPHFCSGLVVVFTTPVSWWQTCFEETKFIKEVNLHYPWFFWMNVAHFVLRFVFFKAVFSELTLIL